LLIIIRLKVQTNLQSPKEAEAPEEKEEEEEAPNNQEAATDGQRILAS
jgi:hypothetical protein